VKRRRAVASTTLSDSVLSEIESIAIKLESGTVKNFVIADELAVSSDPVQVHKQALTAHSRFAFWEYQAARALRTLRSAEIDLARLEGDRRYRYAKAAKQSDPYAASAVVEGLLDSDSSVIAARNNLNQLREHWNILRCVAGALDHRAHLLRKLLAHDHDAKRG